MAFLAYGLYVTLQQRVRALAPGLTSRAVIEKVSALQMVDVCLPTTDGRLLILPRYTQPEEDPSNCCFSDSAWYCLRSRCPESRQSNRISPPEVPPCREDLCFPRTKNESLTNDFPPSS